MVVHACAGFLNDAYVAACCCCIPSLHQVARYHQCRHRFSFCCCAWFTVTARSSCALSHKDFPILTCVVAVQILTAKKVVSAADITGHIEELESYGSRGLGPRVIARAWTDPAFKKRLIEDGVAGVTELGISAEGWLPHGGVTGQYPCLLAFCNAALLPFAVLLLACRCPDLLPCITDYDMSELFSILPVAFWCARPTTCSMFSYAASPFAMSAASLTFLAV